MIDGIVQDQPQTVVNQTQSDCVPKPRFKNAETARLLNRLKATKGLHISRVLGGKRLMEEALAAIGRKRKEGVTEYEQACLEAGKAKAEKKRVLQHDHTMCRKYNCEDCAKKAAIQAKFAAERAKREDSRARRAAMLESSKHSSPFVCNTSVEKDRADTFAESVQK